MNIGFSQPLFLLLLLLLPVLAWVEWKAWTDLVRWRRRVVFFCRLTEVTLLVFALAGLRWERAREEVCVLFAVDASKSVPEAARDAAIKKIVAANDSMKADDRAGVLVFGRQPLIERAPQPRFSIETIDSRPDSDFTDLGSLIRLASGLYPEGMRRRLVLFSDGNENLGDALEAARDAQAASISIDVFPIEAPPRNEVSLTRMDIPGRVEKEEPFELKIEALATESGTATLRIYRDGSVVGRQEVALKEGRNPFSLTFTEDETGFHTYEAVIETPNDVQADNNVAGAYTRASGPSKVLLIGSREANASIENALRLSGLPFDSTPTPPANLATLQRYDSVFLNNIMAPEFRDSQIEALEKYVQDLGGGLGMIGGEGSFGPGGWIGTPVERALPVRMEIKTKEKFPSLALVMAIDKSGSMSGGKMDLANRAAVEAVNLLGPKDLVGVVAFDSAGKWVANLETTENKGKIIKRILSIRAGGGTDAYQGANMAFRALAGAKAQLKHVILMTDGHTSPANFGQLVQDMRANKITLTTVAIGPGSDQPFLENLARDGNGRYYHCPDPSSVPKIFVRETVLAQRSYMIEETDQPVQSAIHPIVDHRSLKTTPPLHGWVVTEMKDRAEAVFKIRKDPLLAAWNYGLGKSVAFTSDAEPRWAKDWTTWDGFMPFWDRVLRWSLRGEASNQLFPRIEFDRGKGKVVVEAATEFGDKLNFLNLKARVIRPDLKVEEYDLRQSAIGTYEVEFDARQPGAYLAGIFGADGRQASAGAMVAFSPEFKDFTSNSYLLHELARRTGGKIEPKVDEIFRREGRKILAAREIFWGLLSVVLALLLIEIAVRRLHIEAERLEKLKASLRNALFLAPPATAGGPGFKDGGLPSALKSRAQATRSRLRRGETEAETFTQDLPESAGGEPVTGGGASPKIYISPSVEDGTFGEDAAEESATKAAEDDTLTQLRAKRKKQSGGGESISISSKLKSEKQVPEAAESQMEARPAMPRNEPEKASRQTEEASKEPAKEETMSELLKAKRRRRQKP